jgi:hypothetical protein
MSGRDAAQTPSTERPLRPRFSTRLITALSAAIKTGLPVRGLKIGRNGEIDIAFDNPIKDESEDLRKLL